LIEIFNFYSHQHMHIGKVTFDRIKEEFDVLDVGEFMKFCNEFKVPCNRVVLNDVFKKIATFANQMTYDQFLVSYN